MDKDFEATLATFPDAGELQDGGTEQASRRRWRDVLLGAIWRKRDEQTGLLTLDALVERGQPLIARSRRGQGALAVFDFHDLPDARDVYGRAAAENLRARIAREMVRLAGKSGIAARTGAVRFTVLLPGAALQEAVDSVHRVLGRPCRIEADLAGDDCVLVPDVVVDICEADAGALAALHAELGNRLDQERRRQLRHKVSVRRERQRHSRPMPVDAG